MYGRVRALRRRHLEAAAVSHAAIAGAHAARPRTRLIHMADGWRKNAEELVRCYAEDLGLLRRRQAQDGGEDECVRWYLHALELTRHLRVCGCKYACVHTDRRTYRQSVCTRMYIRQTLPGALSATRHLIDEMMPPTREHKDPASSHGLPDI